MNLVSLPEELYLFAIGGFLNGQDFFALVRCCRTFWMVSRSHDHSQAIRDRYLVFVPDPSSNLDPPCGRMIIDLPQYRITLDENRNRESFMITIRYDHPRIGFLLLNEKGIRLATEHQLTQISPSGRVELKLTISDRRTGYRTYQWKQGDLEHLTEWQEVTPMMLKQESKTSGEVVERVPGPTIIRLDHYEGAIHYLLPGFFDSVETKDNQNTIQPIDWVTLDEDHLEYRCGQSYLTYTGPLGNFRLTSEGSLKEYNDMVGRYCPIRNLSRMDQTLIQLRKRWGFPEACNLHQALRQRISLLTPERYQAKLIATVQQWHDCEAGLVRKVLSGLTPPMQKHKIALVDDWRLIYDNARYRSTTTPCPKAP